MIVISGGFRDDFHLSATRPVILRGVRVLIDAHFLHRRRGDRGAIGFYAIDDEAGAAGGCGAVIEESAHGGGVVVIEDGQGLEVVCCHDGRVVIVFRGGQVFAAVCGDAYVGGNGGDGENDADGRGEGVCCCSGGGGDCGGCDDDWVVHGFKARFGDDQRVVAGVWRGELEAAVVTRVAGGGEGADRVDEVDFSAGDDGAGGIGDHALYRGCGWRSCGARRLASEGDTGCRKDKDGCGRTKEKGRKAHDAVSPRQNEKRNRVAYF